MSSRRNVKPGVIWAIHLVMPTQPAPDECRHKYRVTKCSATVIVYTLRVLS